MNAYSGRSVKVSELKELTDAITKYAKSSGYTVAQAVVPPQEIAGGQLEIKVYVAKYDEVRLVQNRTDVADSVLQGTCTTCGPARS